MDALSLGQEQPGGLNTLAKVAALSPDEGAKALPVKLRATVTFYDRDRGLLYLQEDNDAVTVRTASSRDQDELDLNPGQVVEVQGTTGRGPKKPQIRAKAIRIAGTAPLPSPLELDGKGVFAENANGRLIRIRGWVPALATSGSRLSLKLIVAPGQSLDVFVDGDGTPEAKELAASYVEAVGVLSLRFEAGGVVAGGRLNVSGLSAIRIAKTLPVIPIAEAGSPKANSHALDPFRFRGNVVNHSLGEFLVLRDNSGSLRIPYRVLTYFNPGSLVEVFAFPLQQRPELELTNVTVKLVPSDTSNEESAAAIITPKTANSNLVTLTKITQIRKLSPQEASRGYPVSISGVITFYDPGSYLHFVQDETSGIYFDLTRIETLPPMHSGQRIQVQGFSGPGDYAPIVLSQSVRIIKDEPYPNPENVTFTKLMGGNFDSQWVLLRGVVRNQWVTTNSATFALFAGDGLIKVVVPGRVPDWSTLNLVDAGIEVQGVCRTIFDDRRRLQGVELQVPDWKQLLITEVSVPDPFKLPVRSVSDLFQFHADAGELHRARLMGVVTLRCADGSVYLQDASGGIQVQLSSSASAPPVGTMAEVVGFPVIVEKGATLQEALVHSLKHTAPIEPVELKPDAALEDSLQATLVRLEGRVMGNFSHGSEEVLTLRFGQKAIDAILEKQSGPDKLADLAPGSVVRLTGVYLTQPNSTAGLQGFRILLRSESDLAVISRPSWWTVQKTLCALGGLAGVLLLALGWVRSLRRQVRQRTGELHEEIEHHKRTEAKLEAEIAERKRMESEVERSHQELMIASRQAGMAEVATSVLHNVGNVLNSVNVSSGVISERIKNSKVNNISRAAELLKAHSGDLGHYLEQDPKGRQLPQYLGRLAQHLNNEQLAILAELDSLRKNVEHIKGIVGMQQSYAKVFGSAEPVQPAELVEDALRLNSGALVRHEVRVIREFESNLPQIIVDRHKLLQILVNLICNAKKACDESLHSEKLLTVKVANEADRLRISVIDNGVGIPKENLTRIFNHGFTTRKDGHGFGLHSGALAAKEMGGALLVHSDGYGKGAMFTVELPVKAPEQELVDSP